MAKIALGAAPASFPARVKFPLLGGGEGELAVEFRYRTRAQFAAFIGELYPSIGDDAPKAKKPAAKFDLRTAADEALDRDVRHLMGAVLSWDLDDEFKAENVKRLVDEYPAAVAALVDAYQTAITQGHSGN